MLKKEITLKFLKNAIIAISFFLSFSSIIEAEDNLADPLAGFQISKDEIKASLMKLKSEGKVSEADYNKALEELNAMNDGQINAMKDKAVGMVRKNPDKAAELANLKPADSKELESKMKELSQP